MDFHFYRSATQGVQHRNNLLHNLRLFTNVRLHGVVSTRTTLLYFSYRHIIITSGEAGTDHLILQQSKKPGMYRGWPSINQTCKYIFFFRNSGSFLDQNPIIYQLTKRRTFPTVWVTVQVISSVITPYSFVGSTSFFLGIYYPHWQMYMFYIFIIAS
jgi:hypothetical protein